MYAYYLYIQLYMFAVNNFHKIYSIVAERTFFLSVSDTKYNFVARCVLYYNKVSTL